MFYTSIFRNFSRYFSFFFNGIFRYFIFFLENIVLQYFPVFLDNRNFRKIPKTSISNYEKIPERLVCHSWKILKNTGKNTEKYPRTSIFFAKPVFLAVFSGILAVFFRFFLLKNTVNTDFFPDLNSDKYREILETFSVFLDIY